MKIVVIDDHDEFREMICEMLEKEGHEVADAPDGKEGIKLIQKFKPQLLITDILMPEQDGYETIIELKKYMPEVKIIAVSGGGRLSPEGYLDVARELGAKTTLMKPFSRDELVLAIDGVFREK